MKNSKNRKKDKTPIKKEIEEVDLYGYFSNKIVNVEYFDSEGKKLSRNIFKISRSQNPYEKVMSFVINPIGTLPDGSFVELHSLSYLVAANRILIDPQYITPTLHASGKKIKFHVDLHEFTKKEAPQIYIRLFSSNQKSSSRFVGKVIYKLERSSLIKDVSLLDSVISFYFRNFDFKIFKDNLMGLRYSFLFIFLALIFIPIHILEVLNQKDSLVGFYRKPFSLLWCLTLFCVCIFGVLFFLVENVLFSYRLEEHLYLLFAAINKAGFISYFLFLITVSLSDPPKAQIVGSLYSLNNKKNFKKYFYQTNTSLLMIGVLVSFSVGDLFFPWGNKYSFFKTTSVHISVIYACVLSYLFNLMLLKFPYLRGTTKVKVFCRFIVLYNFLFFLWYLISERAYIQGYFMRSHYWFGSPRTHLRFLSENYDIIFINFFVSLSLFILFLFVFKKKGNANPD